MGAEPVEIEADVATPRLPHIASCSPPAGKHGLHGLALSGSSSDSKKADTNDGRRTVLELSPRLQLAALLEEVCGHYGVACGAVALHRGSSGALDFSAIRGASAEADAALRRHGTEEADPGEQKLFRHHMKRELPVIIEDINKVRTLRGSHIVTGPPKIRFYVAAPLIEGPHEIVGTISIFDATERHAFTIKDCEALQRAAAKAVMILEEMR